MSQVSTDRRFGVISSSAIKVPVKAATTANITLSGEQTIDGISCVTDDRVLVQNQTTASENGIYTADTGSWERAVDFNGTYDVVEGTIIPVNRGTVYGIRGRRITNTGTITIGTTSLTFGDTLYSSSSGIEFVQSGIGAVARTMQEKEREIISVKDFKNTDETQVALDNTQDDTTGIQRAIVYCETLASGAILHFPGSSSFGKTTTALAISDSIHIMGTGQYTSGIAPVAVNGFNIATGVNGVKIESLEIGLATRFSTSANSLQGIDIAGTTGSHSANHIFNDIYIDGFRDAIAGSFVDRSLFQNVRVGFGKNGLVMTGSSVNNNVIANQYDISGNDGTGISLGAAAATDASEGWIISDSIVYGGNTGIQANYCNNSKIRGCIVDTFTNTGILLISTATGPSTNWEITDNYVGSASANHGIRMKNDFASAQVNGNYIAGNQITHVGGTLTNGIIIDGTEDDNNVIVGNRIIASTRDIRVDSGDNNTIALNQMQGGGFTCSVLVNYWMNVGTNAAAAVNLSDVQGTYTPTLTNVSNLDGSTAYTSTYRRRGNQVDVYGKFDADATAGAATSMGISLPIASALANAEELAGTAAAGTGEVARILGDVTNDRAEVLWTATSTVNQGWSFHFSYRII